MKCDNIKQVNLSKETVLLKYTCMYDIGEVIWSWSLCCSLLVNNFQWTVKAEQTDFVLLLISTNFYFLEFVDFLVN